MKGLRTLGVLVVLLGGLAAYLYYVDAAKPIGEADEKPKVFAVEADQIEELKVSTIAGGVAELKKSADGWYSRARSRFAPTSPRSAASPATWRRCRFNASSTRTRRTSATTGCASQWPR